MNYDDDYDDEEEIERMQSLWRVLMGGAWLLLFVLLAVYDYNVGRVFGSGVAIVIGIKTCKYMKSPGDFMGRMYYAGRKRAAALYRQRAQETAIRDMNTQNAQRRQASNLSQARQEAITRLGSIDNYVRVLEGETDRSRRTVALQAAHSEIIALEAKRASGDIPHEAIADATILAHAQATSDHLGRIGLSRDRLNLELVRIFKLTM